jgi:hypothetical protein
MNLQPFCVRTKKNEANEFKEAKSERLKTASASWFLAFVLRISDFGFRASDLDRRLLGCGCNALRSSRRCGFTWRHENPGSLRKFCEIVVQSRPALGRTLRINSSAPWSFYAEAPKRILVDSGFGLLSALGFRP